MLTQLVICMNTHIMYMHHFTKLYSCITTNMIILSTAYNTLRIRQVDRYAICNFSLPPNTVILPIMST